MKSLYLTAPILLMLIVGCQVTQTKQASFEHSASPAAIHEKSTFTYNPTGKEQFVFHKKADSLQKYGYDKFCPDTKSFSCYENRLSYPTYVGMKGYFDTVVPAKTDYSGYEFYPVVLENGEKYYFVSNNKHGGKYGSSSPIISLKQYMEVVSFKPEPLVAGSNIQIISNEVNYGSKSYELSNGKTVSDKTIKLIREVASRFGNNPKIAELLLDMRINKDEVDYRFFVSPSGDILRSTAQLYIGFNDKSVWLRFKVKYYGDDWLFVDSYKVAADDYRWQSPKINFERDNSSGSVWEWSDSSATDKDIEVANALASATKSIIRFNGNQYYSDENLAEDQKEGIKNILALYSLMKGS